MQLTRSSPGALQHQVDASKAAASTTADAALSDSHTTRTTSKALPASSVSSVQSLVPAPCKSSSPPGTESLCDSLLLTSNLLFEQKRREGFHRSKTHVPSAIPRPLNAWILYRSARLRNEACETLASSSQPVTLTDLKHRQCDLSKRLSEAWKAESVQTRAHFHALASKRQEEHKLLYPNYKYSPRMTDKLVKAREARALAAALAREEKANNEESSRTASRPSRKRALTAPRPSTTTTTSVSSPPCSPVRAAPYGPPPISPRSLPKHNKPLQRRPSYVTSEFNANSAFEQAWQGGQAQLLSLSPQLHSPLQLPEKLGMFDGVGAPTYQQTTTTLHSDDDHSGGLMDFTLPDAFDHQAAMLLLMEDDEEEDEGGLVDQVTPQNNNAAALHMSPSASSCSEVRLLASPVNSPPYAQATFHPMWSSSSSQASLLATDHQHVHAWPAWGKPDPVMSPIQLHSNLQENQHVIFHSPASQPHASPHQQGYFVAHASPPANLERTPDSLSAARNFTGTSISPSQTLCNGNATQDYHQQHSASWDVVVQDAQRAFRRSQTLGAMSPVLLEATTYGVAPSSRVADMVNTTASLHGSYDDTGALLPHALEMQALHRQSRSVALPGTAPKTPVLQLQGTFTEDELLAQLALLRAQRRHS